MAEIRKLFPANNEKVPRAILPTFLFILLGAAVVAEEAPVRLQGQTLFSLKAATADLTAQEAAEVATARLERLAANRSIELSQLHIELESAGTAIRAGSELLVLVTEAEATAHGRKRSELAAEWFNRIRDGVQRYRDTTSVRFWVSLVLYLLLYTLLFAVAVWAVNWLQHRVRTVADWYTQSHLKERGSRLLSLFSAAALLDAVANVVSVARWIVILVLLNFYLNYSIRLFPGTGEISRTLGSYLLSPLVEIGRSVAAYLPNFFFVLLIALIAYYLIRLNNYIFIKVARGAILIDGFYPDWAIPTAKLVRLLILVLAAIAAFPYLPGSHSPAFQGISIFVGVLVSLGSSSTIANVVSGVILTYMRAFQIGDRVKIAGTLGDVMEKNLLVTRLQTIHNEVVTIPNSLIMASQILNYSLLAKDRRLILYTTVTIGYDTPWQRVHELLLAAAAATEGVEPTPAPYVWQRALNDYSVSYELNVFTGDARRMFDLYSSLHGNIQTEFHAAKVEIMTPAFTAIRDGNTMAIPEGNRGADYEAPGFRIAPDRPVT